MIASKTLLIMEPDFFSAKSAGILAQMLRHGSRTPYDSHPGHQFEQVVRHVEFPSEKPLAGGNGIQKELNGWVGHHSAPPIFKFSCRWYL
jgi:hypothetical protein